MKYLELTSTTICYNILSLENIMYIFITVCVINIVLTQYVTGYAVSNDAFSDDAENDITNKINSMTNASCKIGTNVRQARGIETECECGPLGLSCHPVTNRRYFFCACKNGYTTFKQKCDECECKYRQECSIVEDLKICKCWSGYADNNGACEECICEGGLQCSFVDGQKTCSCEEGYKEHNGVCKECFCGKGHDCELRDGEKFCICNDNYQYYNGRCRALDNQICNEEVCLHGTCESTELNSYCKCELGYTGERCDQKKKLFEGKSEECDCGPFGVSCHSVPNTPNFFCACKDGYITYNENCHECICQQHSECRIVEGLKTCECWNGYEKKNGKCVKA